MWLLNIVTRKLASFENREAPPYAILSHRWEADEVTFQDINNGRAAGKAGYAKIDAFCHQILASSPRISYVWVDTCCIDKTSSEELSEAINSMFMWYRKAAMCYAYLVDVYSPVHSDGRRSDVHASEASESESSLANFQQSSWFKRGWTLQELIAPLKVVFWNRDWKYLGTRQKLASCITKITGIPWPILADESPSQVLSLGNYSVAERMSWMSERQTTREEDMAYCLLGIFEVNMPLIYGEGSRAFQRLQEEIVRTTEDPSIFAWGGSGSRGVRASNASFGVFASAPQSFTHKESSFIDISQRLVSHDPQIPWSTSSISIAGSGLEMTCAMIPFYLDVYIVPLGYTMDPNGLSESQNLVAMFIQHETGTRYYQRAFFNSSWLVVNPNLSEHNWPAEVRRVILRRGAALTARNKRPKGTQYGFMPEKFGSHNTDILPYHGAFQSKWWPRAASFSRDPVAMALHASDRTTGLTGFLRIESTDGLFVFLHFGFDFDFNPFCLISRICSSDQRGTSMSQLIPQSNFKADHFWTTSPRDIVRLVRRLESQGYPDDQNADDEKVSMLRWKRAESFRACVHRESDIWVRFSPLENIFREPGSEIPRYSIKFSLYYRPEKQEEMDSTQEIKPPDGIKDLFHKREYFYE